MINESAVDTAELGEGTDGTDVLIPVGRGVDMS